MSYLIGFDIGSSSVKAVLIEAATGKAVGSKTSPNTELPINAPEPGFAEQDPGTWWKHVLLTAQALKRDHSVAMEEVKAIGIAYQMHGLVMVDKKSEVLHPSIIWCDSRAVGNGEKAFREIGEEKCLKHLLNSPGNFTASKLHWIKENRPGIFSRIDKIMLPGDYIALKMTGKASTTISGLSEGIFWDYQKQGVADLILDHYGIPADMLSPASPTFSIQGELTSGAADLLGLPAGIPVAYRAGDQPNNAFSLNVLEPGELATTAGTSGVVYAVGDKPHYDKKSRVNTFVHVNHKPGRERYGTLLCLNGCGISNSWIRREIFSNGGELTPYPVIDERAKKIPAGSDGLTFLPFGNGAERILENRYPGALLGGLDLNKHTKAHIGRAVQEGIVFALNYGINIMKEMGIGVQKVKAGKANLFLSPLFRKIFATTTGAVVELYNTDGAQGAARGAGLGAGIYKTEKEAFGNLQMIDQVDPDASLENEYSDAYKRWLGILDKQMSGDL